ncbi:hypothetical protein [Thalassobaculum sp.]
MRYLLDTNIVSDLVRNPGGRVTDNEREFARLAQLPCENWLRQA